jgi:hypothetical protein
MTPEQPDRDLDKEFEDLVANWDSTGPPSTPAEPPLPRPGVNIWRGPTVWRPPEDTLETAADQSAAPEPGEDEDDDFQPEPVSLPPQEDLHFWGIVVGLLGGGLLLLYVALTGGSTSSWWFLTAVSLFVGGFALLILRQPKDRDTTDDGTRL